MKNILTKLKTIGHTGAIKISKGGRFPFRSEITAKNQIVFESNNIALSEALNGGRSSILRDMGAFTFGDVDIPATLFNINRKGELTKGGSK